MNMPKMNAKELLALSLIEAISEEMVSSVYLKARNQMLQQGSQSIDSAFTFYISVYYGDRMLKSRVLNSKKHNYAEKQLEELQEEFFQKNRKKKNEDAVFRITEKIEKRFTTLLRVGELTIIVSDSQKFSTEVFSLVLAIMYTLNKAATFTKEWGQFHDLKNYFLKEDGDMYNITLGVEQIAFGERGGHKPE